MTSPATASPTSRRSRGDQSLGALHDLLDSQREALAQLEAAVNDQRQALAQVTAELQELRSAAARGQREVLHRLSELHGLAPYSPHHHERPEQHTTAPHPPAPDVAETDVAVPNAGAPLSQADYARLVIRVRALVRTMVPGHAVAAVVSRGDDALTDLDGRTGWHFPQCDDGRYAGHYPRDSESAISHLEDLRRRGARYLVIPATALWWLDHYAGLRAHLEHHYRLLVHRTDACAIFALDRQESAS